MVPEKSAGEQMQDAFGTTHNGVETLPYITVLNRWLLEKLGVEVPKNLAGKPIVLSDGSGKRTDNFYHLGECGLGEKRTREVMAKAQENLVGMTQEQILHVRTQISSNSYGEYAGMEDKKEYLDPQKRQAARDLIQKAHKEGVIDARERKDVMAARIRVERIFEQAENIGTKAQLKLAVDLQNGRVSAVDHAASLKAINDLERRTESRDISIAQRNTILQGALDAPRINAQMTRLDAEYLALVQRTNVNTMAKYPGKTILIGAGDQQFAIPVTQSNALGVVTGETFNPSDNKLLPGSVTRSSAVADIRLSLAKLQLAPSKQVAAGLDLSNPVHVEAAKRLLSGEEFLKRGFVKGHSVNDHSLSPAMELEFTQYAMSDRGSAMLAGIHKDFDAHILKGEVMRNSREEYVFYLDHKQLGAHFFAVKTMSDLGAKAGLRHIELGDRFGRVIPISGQTVMGPEIVHHEFGHTSYGIGRTGRTIGGRELGFGEARVVRDFEEAFREDFGWPKRGNYCYRFGCFDSSQAQEGEFEKTTDR